MSKSPISHHGPYTLWPWLIAPTALREYVLEHACEAPCDRCFVVLVDQRTHARCGDPFAGEVLDELYLDDGSLLILVRRG